jgi:hypothetical protein
MTTVGTPHVPIGTARTTKLFRDACLALGLVGFIKYAALAVTALADNDFGNAPHFFLVFLVLPYVVCAVLARRTPPASAILFLLFGGLFAWLMIQQIVGGIEDYWGDYMLVFVGLPISLAGLVLAVRVLMRR